MKKLFLVAIIAAGIVSSSAFAEQKLVQCDSKTIYSENTCDVCYEDTATGTGTTLDIKDVKIPWKNETTTSEVIYKLESKQPEIITSLTTATTPTDAKDVWKFTNPWTGTLNEFVLTAGKTVNFVETNTTAKITVTDKTDVTDKTVLIKSPLVYHERNTTSEDKTPKTRNTCVLYAVTFDSSVMSSEVSVSDTSTDASNTTDTTTDAATDTPTTDTTTDTTSTDAATDTSADTTIDTALNSAPEEKTSSLNSAGGMPNQTSIETGPAENIFFLTALLLSTCIFFFQKKYISSSRAR